MDSWFLVRHGETDRNLHSRIKVNCAGLSVISNQPNCRALELWDDTKYLTSTGAGGLA